MTKHEKLVRALYHALHSGQSLDQPYLEWSSVGKVERAALSRGADAILSELREPDEGMLLMGQIAANKIGDVSLEELLGAWQAMLDEVK